MLWTYFCRWYWSAPWHCNHPDVDVKTLSERESTAETMTISSSSLHNLFLRDACWSSCLTLSDDKHVEKKTKRSPQSLTEDPPNIKRLRYSFLYSRTCWHLSRCTHAFGDIPLGRSVGSFLHYSRSALSNFHGHLLPLIDTRVSCFRFYYEWVELSAPSQARLPRGAGKAGFSTSMILHRLHERYSTPLRKTLSRKSISSKAW